MMKRTMREELAKIVESIDDMKEKRTTLPTPLNFFVGLDEEIRTLECDLVRKTPQEETRGWLLKEVERLEKEVHDTTMERDSCYDIIAELRARVAEREDASSTTVEREAKT